MSKPDRLLVNAGGLLLAVAAATATVGGLFGLAHRRPGIIVFSLVLLMGFGVVGYLLMNDGKRYFRYALPGTAVLVFASLFLFHEVQFNEAADMTRFVLYPAIAALLASAAGALVTHLLEETYDAKVRWPAKGTSSLNALLHVTGFAVVWCGFTLLAWMGPATPLVRLLVVGGSVGVAIACAVGGHAASRGNPPLHTLVGALLGFGASALYLFQFMASGGDPDLAGFGQFVALVGLVVSGLPVAIGAVAAIQANSGTLADEEPAPLKAE